MPTMCASERNILRAMRLRLSSPLVSTLYTLYGHVATIVGIVREIHDARAAAANFVDDHVLADLFRQRCATIWETWRGGDG